MASSVTPEELPLVIESPNGMMRTGTAQGVAVRVGVLETVGVGVLVGVFEGLGDGVDVADTDGDLVGFGVAKGVST